MSATLAPELVSDAEAWAVTVMGQHTFGGWYALYLYLAAARLEEDGTDALQPGDDAVLRQVASQLWRAQRWGGRAALPQQQPTRTSTVLRGDATSASSATMLLLLQREIALICPESTPAAINYRTLRRDDRRGR